MLNILNKYDELKKLDPKKAKLEFYNLKLKHMKSG